MNSNSLKLVCPDNETLIEKFQNRAIIIKTNDIERIPYIEKYVNRFNKLHCILVNRNDNLSSYRFKDEWKNIPLCLIVENIGNFIDLAFVLPTLRKSNIRIFLNTDKSENFSALKILCSLGVDCGIIFGNSHIDWEAVNDLMSFAIYNFKAHNAIIEPFQYIASNYQPTEKLDLNNVYFNDPNNYLHIDDEGNISLSEKNMNEKNFISANIEEIGNIHNLKEFKDKIYEWQIHFIENDICSCCKTWRICLGKFYNVDNLECKNFFPDMIEAADFYRKSHKEKVLWQH